MRLNQFLASATALSRRSADDAIRAGRVTINGSIATLGTSAAPEDAVELDGRRVIPPTEFDYLMLHKPVGYITSRVQQGNSPTVYELLPPHLRHLQSVGRLDKDSSGLLLFTNDGGFAQRLTHPSYDKTKTYEITLDRPVIEADLARLARGVELEDGLSTVEVINHAGRSLTVSLSEGRNRQLRRTFAALGYEVKVLHRTSFGPYLLGDLAPGAHQPFHAEAAA